MTTDRKPVWSYEHEPTGRVSWRYTYRDHAGRWHTTSAPTEQEAWARRKKRMGEARAIRSQRENPTLEEFIDYWLDVKSTGGLAANAEAAYRHRLNMLPRWLVRMKMRAITPRNLQDALDDVASTDTYFGKPPASGTVVQIRGHLVQIWRRAMLDGVVASNMAEPTVVAPTQTEEIDPFNRDEMRRILEVVHDGYPRYFALYRVSATVGPRQGEAFGARWEQFDLDRDPSWLIDRQATSGPDHEMHFKEPKGDSIRRVALPPSVRDDLVEWRGEWPRDQGRDPQPDDLVWPSPTGNVLSRGNLRERVHKKALRKAGVEYRRWHTLRHTAATHMLAAGWTPRQVMDALGHKSLGSVMRYQHVLDRMRHEKASDLDDYWGQA